MDDVLRCGLRSPCRKGRPETRLFVSRTGTHQRETVRRYSAAAQSWLEYAYAGVAGCTGSACEGGLRAHLDQTIRRRTLSPDTGGPENSRRIRICRAAT